MADRFDPRQEYANVTEVEEFVIFGRDDDRLRRVLADVVTEEEIAGMRFRVNPVHHCYPVAGDHRRPPFKYETDLPVFDDDLSAARRPPGERLSQLNHAFVWVCSHPRTAQRAQAAAATRADPPRTGFSASAIDVDEFADPRRLSQSKIDRIREGLSESEPVVPSPVIELDRDGGIRGFQEGRHRLYTADQMGWSRVNWLIAAHHRKTDGVRL